MKSADEALFKRGIIYHYALLLVVEVCVISAFHYKYTYECCSYDYVDHDCTSCLLILADR